MAVCSTILPPVSAEICDAKVTFGRIDVLLFTRLGDDFTDVSSATEWATRLSNTTVLPAAGTDAPVRSLNVVGGLAEPDVTEIEISRGRKISGAPKFTLALRVDDTGSENLAFLRLLVGKSQTYAVWFINNGKLYGGVAGIEGTVSVKGLVIPESADAVNYIPVTVTFTEFPDSVIDNPIA